MRLLKHTKKTNLPAGKLKPGDSILSLRKFNVLFLQANNV